VRGVREHVLSALHYKYCFPAALLCGGTAHGFAPTAGLYTVLPDTLRAHLSTGTSVLITFNTEESYEKL
jgi:hypothetical protein